MLLRLKKFFDGWVVGWICEWRWCHSKYSVKLQGPGFLEIRDRPRDLEFQSSPGDDRDPSLIINYLLQATEYESESMPKSRVRAALLKIKSTTYKLSFFPIS